MLRLEKAFTLDTERAPRGRLDFDRSAIMTKITITELANRLGVSICTVNKALSGKPKVSEATRQRVVEEAQRLGYHPNRAAQVLARNPIRFAYLRPDHFDSFFAPFEAGLRKGAERLTDHRVSIGAQRLDPERWEKQLLPKVRSLLRAGLAGLILSPMPGANHGPLWELLSEQHVPLAQLGLEAPGSPAILTVRQDTLLSGKMAAELLSQFPGPTAIMIGDRQTNDHQEKLRGFQSEAARQNLTVAQVVEHHDDPKLGYTMTCRLLQEHPEVRSIYVATDNFSGILRSLKECGTAGRIRVVATGLFPEIRTAMDEGLVHFSLHQRMAEQGELVIQRLHDMLSQHFREPQRVLLPPWIAIRSNIDSLSAPISVNKSASL